MPLQKGVLEIVYTTNTFFQNRPLTYYQCARIIVYPPGNVDVCISDGKHRLRRTFHFLEKFLLLTLDLRLVYVGCFNDSCLRRWCTECRVGGFKLFLAEIFLKTNKQTNPFLQISCVQTLQIWQIGHGFCVIKTDDKIKIKNPFLLKKKNVYKCFLRFR